MSATKAIVLAMALSASLGSASPVALNSSSSSSSSSSIGKRAASLTPNGKKAGSAGGNAYEFWQDHIGWWYDWSPNPQKDGTPIGVAMLWGDGDGQPSNPVDQERFDAFQQLSDTPTYLLGFNEPDCSSYDSSNIPDKQHAADVWDQYIKPWGDKGSLLGSPSMCAQYDENWLQPFRDDISRDWDFTAIHVYKNSMDGVNKDLDHYAQYGKPIWVTEFGCVDDQGGFNPCTDQGEINDFINSIVDLFENDERVMAYGYTDGNGLGDAWTPTRDGQLTESGQTYLDAISKYN